jgi:ankyrin repeat protein
MGWRPFAPSKPAGWIRSSARRGRAAEDHRSPLAKDQSGWTPFIYACVGGKKQTVEILLNQSHLDVNAKDQEGRTALYHACAYGQTEIVKLLLENKADPNVTGRNLVTPLHSAIRYDGDIKIIESLLSHGANPNSMDRNNRTPTTAAASSQRKNQLLPLLKKFGGIE